MADKSVSELNNATSTKEQDLYLVSQKNELGKYESKKIDWSIIKNNIKSFLQGFFVRTDGTNQNVAGSKTFTGNFEYSAIEEANQNAYRSIWFSDNTKKGKPVYDNDFKYNPNTNILDVKTLKTGVKLENSPADTATGHELVDAAWVRNVIQVDDSTIVLEYVSSSGNDENDGKTEDKPKKSIDAAMSVLNSYRLSSPTGLNIQMKILGEYDIFTNNKTPYNPTIAHPDASNQNNLLISGNAITYDTDGKIQFSSSLSTSKRINNYEWQILIKPIVNNLNFYNIKLQGFIEKKNAPYAILACMDTPMTKMSFNNVAITNGFTTLFNTQVIPSRLDLYNYVAFSSLQLNCPIPSVVMWSSNEKGINITGRDPHSEQTKTEVLQLSGSQVPTLVLKNISSCEWDIIFHHSSPYHDRATRCDIVLDNVSCKISTDILGYKRILAGDANGSEYYFSIYCINGTDLKTVFPNVTENDYNMIHTDAPSWYDPNWDNN